MTKLKTLKELRQYHDDEYCKIEEIHKCSAFRFIDKGELRNEAIRDIHRFNLEKKGKAEWNFLHHTATEEEYDAIIKYIKWKFNLTDEELK